MEIGLLNAIGIAQWPIQKRGCWMKHDEKDEVLEALSTLVAVLHENIQRGSRALERAEEIRRRRESGLRYSEIARAEERPLIVELASMNQQALNEAGSKFRQAQARALHREGLSMDAIAKLFGVTRQRVSALLKSSSR
jgi:hypothetical protein